MKHFYLLLIILTLCSCEREMYYRRSSEPLTYDEVKNSGPFPAYVKYDIDFATTIDIIFANNDTSEYQWTDFGYYKVDSNTTNYIKGIRIEGIRWKGAVTTLLNFSDTINRDSSRFCFRYKSNYDLVDENSGTLTREGYAFYRVNRLNDNNELFEVYNISNRDGQNPIYQQKPTNTAKEYEYEVTPYVWVKNTMGINNLRTIGRMINSLARKSADTTIVYYNKYY